MEEKEIAVLRNIYKIYYSGDTEVFALRDVSLTIRERDFIVLMGPSGSGKSTLLHILAGIDRATKGECLVMGEDIATHTEGELAAWRNANIGFVFQTFNLVPVLSALENVELPLLLTGLSGSERRRHATLALELVGLGDRIHHRPRQLSGGQEQRVAIARALVTDPPFIVADEPTGNLDAVAATECLRLLQRLNRELGKTIIMVTHDPKASAYGKRIVHLEKGNFAHEEAVVGEPSSGAHEVPAAH
jgi:putative ABC transport system ATP-binding protein